MQVCGRRGGRGADHHRPQPDTGRLVGHKGPQLRGLSGVARGIRLVCNYHWFSLLDMIELIGKK